MSASWQPGDGSAQSTHDITIRQNPHDPRRTLRPRPARPEGRQRETRQPYRPDDRAGTRAGGGRDALPAADGGRRVPGDEPGGAAAGGERGAEGGVRDRAARAQPRPQDAGRSLNAKLDAPSGAKPGALLLDRRFAPLFWCQAFAAFNDNFLKTALVVLILYRAKGSPALVALAGGVFILPFLLCSGIAGEMADRFDKARVATLVKGIEIGAAGLAVAGFLAGSVPVLFAALLAFGVLAALFGPVKYGLLPDLLETARLPLANAMVDFATFLAILAGTALGGLLGARAPWLLGAVVMGFALLAFGAAALIPRPGAARPGLKLSASPVAASADLLRTLRGAAPLWRAALVNAWFWFAGITCMTLLPVLTRTTLLRGPGAVTLGLTVFSLGVGAGSFLAASQLRGRIALAPAWGGTVAVGIAALALGALAAADRFGVTLALLFVVALGGGVIAVPSFAAVQAWAPAEARARAVAGTNILSAAGMVAASLILTVLLHAGAAPSALFAGLGAIALSLALAARR
ncbi:MAG: hypothetical protein B7Z76_12860 [Acidiphilium sp. 20-67-58]|nr:MAG: hypothetical protein B7Z76_12860 [Acidiphilium sp. 20-67-58]